MTAYAGDVGKPLQPVITEPDPYPGSKAAKLAGNDTSGNSDQVN